MCRRRRPRAAAAREQLRCVEAAPSSRSAAAQASKKKGSVPRVGLLSRSALTRGSTHAAKDFTHHLYLVCQLHHTRHAAACTCYTPTRGTQRAPPLRVTRTTQRLEPRGLSFFHWTSCSRGPSLSRQQSRKAHLMMMMKNIRL
jgi:hypothetical protein